MLTACILVASTMPNASSPTIGSDVHRPPADNQGLRVDWMRFDSGEWYNGDFESLRKNEIEFDADKGGLATWDFDDVTDLFLARENRVVFADKSTATGIISVTGDEVRVA